MRWELARLPRLLSGVGAHGIPAASSEVSSEHIRALRRGLPWGRATFAIHFAAVRAFLRWAGNPIADHKAVWRLGSGQPSRRRWLSREQLARLLSSARGRDRLLVALEGLNGLRRIEVLRLRKEDVLLDEGCLRVLGKGRDGGKWRKIPIHPTVWEALNALPLREAPDGRLFPLSPSGADQVLARVVRQARMGTEGARVSHHDLRRTFGRLAHESGMDLVQLKNLMGHASIDMTVHYIGLDAEEMRRGLSRLRLPLTGAGSSVPVGPRSAPGRTRMRPRASFGRTGAGRRDPSRRRRL
ncbi:MAG TPA: site-specific integrase [Thermoplasmata archaeon]|nr:site-specific integrase [Thermoplasmata archaeon]